MTEPDTIAPGLIAIVQRALGDVRALLREEVRREVETQVQRALVLGEVTKAREASNGVVLIVGFDGGGPDLLPVPSLEGDTAQPEPIEDVPPPPAIVADAAPTLLDDIEAFMAQHDLGAERFGHLCCGQKTLVWTLRKGRKPGVLVRERIRKFMRDYRPAVARRAEPVKPAIAAPIVVPPPIMPPALPEDDGGEGVAEFARAIEVVRDKPIEIKPVVPIDTARLAAAYERTAKKKAARVMLPPTRVPRFQGMRWCEQCTQRVAWAKAELCRSQFCKVEL